MLIGRADTLRQVSDLLAAPGAVALLTGIPGAGKTAVLDAVRAAGGRTLAATGALSDRHLPYTALADLITDDQLLAAVAGESPHPLRLRLDVLAWLESEAESGPLLITLDDAQWCDETSLSVLGFIARRLRGTNVAFLAACRDNEIPAALAGLPAVALPPLGEHDAIRLLKQAGVDLAGATLPRILDRAAGNPLALLELGRAATADSEPTTVELAFAARFRALPAATRATLLLVAAGDGDLRTVGRAEDPAALLRRLGPAEAAGLVTVAGHTVRFQHPLARSAAYQLGTTEDRVRAHRRLADAHHDDPDRRVWHLAEATIVTDESVAAALEQTAERAQRRGAYAEATRSLIRAAELSPAPADRERRTLNAAWTASGGGFFEWIIQLAGPLHDRSTDRSTRAIASHMLAYAISQTSRQRDAWGAVLAALELVQDEEPHWGWSSLTTLAVLAYRRGSDGPLVERWLDRYDRISARRGPLPAPIVACRAWIRAEIDPFDRPPDILDLIHDDPVPDGPPTEMANHEMMLGAAAWVLDDSRTALIRLGRAVELFRKGGPANMTNTLMTLAQVQLDLGDFDAAEQSSRLLVDLAATIGHAFAGEHGFELGARAAAVRGQVELAREMCGTGLRTLTPGEYRVLEVTSHVTRAYIAVAERDADGAWSALQPLFDASGEPLHPHMSYREIALYVVTGVRAGLLDELRPVVDRAGKRLAGAAPRLRFQLARARAQLAGDGAEPFHLAATADPAAAQWPFELACARLEYGAWLRRRQRSRDARAELHAASIAFVRMDARPWADLAAAELRAAGVTAFEPATSAWTTLTGQEREVVRLAAAGLTNREIGASLFLSARTVSTHLYKAFPKLGVTSRAQLRDLVPGDRG
ncbi:LuxR C-terminal-related transcriptional regulator [Actinoplanes sp. L3-i22]|uniref:LuxR C-terminal-related transcriptional regulator n=1 Tax=Actinoplanes sp. L3-i22 TaxID=2836373 RepID=UPI001C78C310|nr:LuxR family transcriptional regulator [Actinoplanes sp. L3-i22]BCY08260.1 transcriptional regulator [Actinoplanes sp. L3-i22]